MASPTLNVALKDGFGEAVIECDIPEPCKFPYPDSSQKRFLWIHKEVDLAPYLVVGLKLQVGNAEKFPQAPSFESLYILITTGLDKEVSREGREGDKGKEGE